MKKKLESSHDSGREKESTQSGGGGGGGVVEPMVTTETNTYRTRSGRIVKPPDRFDY